jgi:hypothetical protein
MFVVQFTVCTMCFVTVYIYDIIVIIYSSLLSSGLVITSQFSPVAVMSHTSSSMVNSGECGYCIQCVVMIMILFNCIVYHVDLIFSVLIKYLSFVVNLL